MSATLLAPTIVAAANNDPFRGGREAVNPKPSAGVGESTGAMTYNYPFVIPPGRNGMQPNVSLVYSSADKRQDSLFGYGWSMSLPYIERVNKLGTNNLYNQDRAHTFFTSSLSGDLLPVGNTTPVGGSFLGMSLSTPRLSLLEMPQKLALLDTISDPPPPTVDPEDVFPSQPVEEGPSQRVSDEVVRSFHTFADTFLPTHIYHPNEWEEWNAARAVASEEAKRPIPGFPIAEKLVARTSVIPNPLVPALENLPADEKAALKGQAIAELGSMSKTRRGNYFIEIESMHAIPKGVELFARVWDANNNPIGFGTDGTVEIERFRFFNPPILVDDPNGDIVRTVTVSATGETRERRLREDLREALLQSLEHTIKVKKQKFDGAHIIQGKVGNTTSTFYPAAGATSPADGYTQNAVSATTWATIHDAGTGTDGAAASHVSSNPLMQGSSGSWTRFDRYLVSFDTTAIGSGQQVDSAVLSLSTYPGFASNGHSVSYNIYGSNFATPGNITSADYDAIPNITAGGGATELATTQAYSSLTSTGYHDWTLNASGEASIDMTGTTTKFAYLSTADGGNSEPGGSGTSYIATYLADEAGTTNDPKLVVEHSAAAPSGYTFATTTLQDLNYTYDAVGNITQIIDRSGTKSAATTTYTYDALYRLTQGSTTQATTTDWLQTYAYNDLGSITSKSDVGSYTYAGTGYANPHAATTINGTGLTYDNAGNLLTYGNNTYVWNYRNRMMWASTSASTGTTTGYTYDFNDQRVTQAIKMGSGATTTTTYFNQFYEVTGATTTLYIFAGGQLVATIEGNGGATSTYVAHSDHLGGSSVMSDKYGALAQLATYYPFGSIRQNEKPSNDFNEKRKYIGQYYDDATALSYLNARYYNGTNGQFTSQDPMFTGDPKQQNLTSPQDLNAYSYASNNPSSKSDPTGKFWYYGWWDWTGYDGWRGVGMKVLEIAGGHRHAMNAIAANQSTVNQDSANNNLDPNLTNAFIQEEQSHLLNLPRAPFESVKDYAFPNSNLGGYDGGVGTMQVSGAVAQKYGGYTKTEVARDSQKNIAAGTAYLGSISNNVGSTNYTAIGQQYNGSAAYGERINAQMQNPNYNKNIFTGAATSFWSAGVQYMSTITVTIANGLTTTSANVARVFN